MTSSLEHFKGRYLVTAWLVSWLFVPATLIMALFDYPQEWYWWDIGYYIPGQLFLGVIILLVGVSVHLNFRPFFGPVPNVTTLKELSILFCFLWVLTGAIDFMTFFPLSFIQPEFVAWWYIDLSPVLYTKGQSFPLIPNVLSFISLVIFAPILEEVLFRGYLLRRWSHKWGVIRAIAFSSLIFGVAHPDIISATIFGVAMCIVYLRSGSLIGPILFHAAWNLLFWLWEYYALMTKGLDYRYTLEEFQSDWPWGILWIFLSILFMYLFSLQKGTQRIWHLPAA